MAAIHNITADYGTTVRRTFTWTRKVAGAVVPLDLTGATAVFTVAKRAGEPAIFSLTEGDGITLGGADGTILVLINPADWPASAPAQGAYQCELLVTLADATRVKLVEGKFTIRETLAT